MGGFYIVQGSRDAERDRIVDRLQGSFRAQGFAEPRVFAGSGWVVGIYPDFHGRMSVVVETESRELRAFATGTLCHRLRFGIDALQSLDASFDGRLPDAAELSGAFAVVLVRGDRLYVHGDPVGLYRLYASVGSRVVTTSFLAATAAVTSPRASLQGVYEYVFQETTFGEDTVVEQVRAVPAYGLSVLNDGQITTGEQFAIPPGEFAPGSMQDHADHLRDRIRSVFGGIASAYGNRISTALSGGFDSRLTLASLMDRGVMPEIHVYGRSADADVQIARTIAAGEGFALEHVDKSRWSGDDPEAFAECVRRNFCRFDGLPSDGILDWGADFETRLQRTAGGELHLNGGGGEVMRNFFYLPGGAISVRQFLWSFYSRYDREACTSAFREDQYVDSLACKIRECLSLSSSTLERAQVELLYPFFRCRFWTGRNNSINSRFGREMTPFLDYGLIARAARVPLDFKNLGRIEARLIQMQAPRLAGYPSAYGYAFDSEPPFKYRAAAAANRLRPPWVRRWSFMIHNRLANRAGSAARGVRFVDAIVDPTLPRASTWFRPDRIGDAGQFRRLVTLEYFLKASGTTV